MPNDCVLCSARLSGGLVDCSHRDSLVHFSCCKDKCSLDGSGPANCPHATGRYRRTSF